MGKLPLLAHGKMHFILMVFRKDKCGIMLKVISRSFDIRISWGLTLVPIGR